MLTRDGSRAPPILGQSDHRQAVIRFLASALAIAALIAVLIAVISLIDTDV